MTFSRNNFKGITPKQIDKTVKNFCKTVRYGVEPVYVKINPWENATINECVHNVANYIKKYGGEAVNGWTIWLYPHCMIEAEFHVIHQDEQGILTDVTPHGNIEKILFLPDETVEYNGCQINNIRKNISNSKLIDMAIQNCNEIFKMTNKNTLKYTHGQITFEGDDCDKYMDLLNNFALLLEEFYCNLKLKPNAPCICGSGEKFVNCCKSK